jgi:flagellar L-ring protein FlgH
MNVKSRTATVRERMRQAATVFDMEAIMTRMLVVVVALAWISGASAQSLFVQAPPPAPVATTEMVPTAAPAEPGPGTAQRGGLSLGQTSLLAIEPPRPRQYERHDQVTIVVDEVSRQQAEQSLKTDKSYGIDATLSAAIDPWELLEARLRQADIDRLRLIDAGAKQRFDGKGRYERNDRFTMKIQATIIDVKPNGVLVLEAQKTIDKNGEVTTTVLSGSCRQEDITGNNTIFSSQLADLTLISRQEGQVHKAGRKGLIPRVLETVFAF